MLFELTLRFSSGVECKVKYCKELGYREHFHCMDCNFRVFIKKEEMVRHYKWHRKREESLQHGFMRYSPLDDCSQKYGTCTHNGRQTHYHCLQVSQRCKPPCRIVHTVNQLLFTRTWLVMNWFARTYFHNHKHGFANDFKHRKEVLP